MQQVTIKDIARLAGVSVTTVSRALNHAPEIRAETRERILKLCREQGYRTNLLARSLVSSRSNVLGLILPSISNPFYAALALNIETFARERGYQVMLSTGRPGDDRIETLFDFLISQRVDAVLLANASDAAHVLLGRYHETPPACASTPSAWTTMPGDIWRRSICTAWATGGWCIWGGAWVPPLIPCATRASGMPPGSWEWSCGPWRTQEVPPA